MAGCRDPLIVQLNRFLYLGDEEKLFPDSVRFPFQQEKVKDLVEAAKTVTDVAQEISRVYKEGNFLGIEPLIYSLALCAHSGSDLSKHEVYDVVWQICQSAESMFCFSHFYKEISKTTGGWGRGHRKFLRNWYNGKDPKDLAKEVTKVKSRHKWTHKDILCMAHVKAITKGSSAVLKYCMRGLEAAEKEGENLPEAQSALEYLKGVTKLCNEKEPETAARLIELYDLCLEHVPTTLLKSKEVILCLIPRIPLDQLLHLLPSFYKRNVLKPNTATFKAAVERLTSETALTDTSIHPLQSFLAVRRWQNATKIVPGRPKLNTKALDDALCSLHDASFKNVSSKDKRYLIALDVHPEMNSTHCAGCNVMSPSHVSDIILMALVKAELSNVTVVVFSETELVSVDIDEKMTLSDIVEQLSQVKPGPVQLSAPISWALQKKKPFDSFLVFSNTLKCSLEDECAAALKEYKETLHLSDSRFIMCSLHDRKPAFSLDKLDMLNVIGFNVNLLKIIQDFTSGVF